MAMIDDALFWAREVDVDGFRVDAVKHFLYAATRRLRAKLHDEFEHAEPLYYLVGETFDGDRSFINSFIGPHGAARAVRLPASTSPSATRSRATRATLRDLESGDGGVRRGLRRRADVAVLRQPRRRALLDVGRRHADRRSAGQAWSAPPATPTTENAYFKQRLALTFVATSPGVPHRLLRRRIRAARRRRSRQPPLHEVDAATAPFEQATLDVTKKLGAARAELVALRRGDRKTLWVDDDHYVFARTTTSKDVAIVVINRDFNAPFVQAVPVPSYVPLADGTVLQDRLGGPSVTVDRRNDSHQPGYPFECGPSTMKRMTPSPRDIAFCCIAATSPVAAQQRTWNFLTTGNGYGFQVFDTNANKITQFLEHPYRYLRPSPIRSARRRRGAPQPRLRLLLRRARRRHLGLAQRADQRRRSRLRRRDATSSTRRRRSARCTAESYFFAPFDLSRQRHGRPLEGARRHRRLRALQLPHGHREHARLARLRRREHPLHHRERRPSSRPGRAAAHRLRAAVGRRHRRLPERLLQGRRAAWTSTQNTSCSGNDVVPALPEEARRQRLDGGRRRVRRQHQPGRRRRRRRAITTWANNRAPDQILADARAEFEAWRKPPPATVPLCGDDETRLWRQSEAVLRMGQIREPNTATRKNNGMMLASLPPGSWHTGWVRDATYAVVALARSGHIDEAKAALNFFLNADAGRRVRAATRTTSTTASR